MSHSSGGDSVLSKAELKAAMEEAKANQAHKPMFYQVLPETTCIPKEMHGVYQVAVFHLRTDGIYPQHASRVDQVLPQHVQTHKNIEITLQFLGRVAELAHAECATLGDVAPPRPPAASAVMKVASKSNVVLKRDINGVPIESRKSMLARKKKEKEAKKANKAQRKALANKRAAVAAARRGQEQDLYADDDDIAVNEQDNYDDCDEDEDCMDDTSEESEDDAETEVVDDDDEETEIESDGERVLGGNSSASGFLQLPRSLASASSIDSGASRAPFRVYLECTMRTRSLVADSTGRFDHASLLKSGMTGIRFFLVSFHHRIDLNAIARSIIDGNIKRATEQNDRAGLASGRIASSIKEEDDQLPWDQKWRLIKSEQDWLAYCDLNTQWKYATLPSDKHYSTSSARAGQAPSSLTKAFNITWALDKVTEDTYPCQGYFASPEHYIVESYNQELKRDAIVYDAANCMTLRPPMPEFWHCLMPNACTSAGFWCRYFPDYQRSTFQRLCGMFAASMGNVLNSSSNQNADEELSKPIYAPFIDYKNPIYASERGGGDAQSSRSEPVNARHLIVDNGQPTAMTDFEKSLRAENFTPEEIRAALANVQGDRVALDGEGGDVHALKRQRAPRTRLEALMRRAASHGISFTTGGGTRVERYDVRTLALTNRIFDKAATEWDQQNLYFHSSPFAILQRDGELISRAIESSLRARLKNPLSAQRELAHGSGSPELRARFMMLLAQMGALEGYSRGCRSPSSFISEIGRIIHTHRLLRHIYEPNVHKVNPFCFDPSMGSFANRQCLRMTIIVHTFKLAKNAPHCDTIVTGSLDAYRQTYNLHVNILHFGPGGVGKSNMLDLVEKWFLIQETVTKLQRQTARSSSVQGDFNDTIMFFHEIQMDQLSEKGANGASGGNSVEAAFKERLTSQENRVETLLIKKNGARESVVIYNSAIGVWIGNSNSPFGAASGASGAMLSRFIVKCFDTGVEDTTGILERIIEEDFNVDGLKPDRERFSLEMRLLQTLHYEVEKMICTHVLHQVSQHAALIMQQSVMSVLKRYGVVPEHVRFHQRNILLMRLYTISQALYDNFLNPGAPYQHRTIEMSSFLALDQALQISTPAIVWVLGLTEDQLIPTYDVQVLRGIKYMLLRQPSPLSLPFREAERRKLNHDMAAAAAGRTVTRSVSVSYARPGASAQTNDGVGANASVQRHISGSALLPRPQSALPINDITRLLARSDSYDGQATAAAAAIAAENAAAEATAAAAAAKAAEDAAVSPDMDCDDFDRALRQAETARLKHVITNMNGLPIIANYYHLHKSSDYEALVDAITASCKAIAHGHSEPTRHMVADTLARLARNNYASRNYCFAEASFPHLTPFEREYVGQNNLLRVTLNPAESTPSIIFQHDTYGARILCDYLDNMIQAADESNESLMTAAIREVFSKRHQHTGIYAFGREVVDNPGLVMRLQLGPGSTPEKVLEVEGYWRQAHANHVNAQREASQALEGSSNVSSRPTLASQFAKRTLAFPQAHYVTSANEAPPFFIPNFFWAPRAQKLLTLGHDSTENYEMCLDTEVTDAELFETATREESRIVELEQPIDEWAAIHRAKLLHITDEAVSEALITMQPESKEFLKAMKRSQVADTRRTAGTNNANGIENDDDVADDDDDDTDELTDNFERQLRLERTCRGTAEESIHVEGHCYFFGVEVLMAEDADGSNSATSTFGTSAMESHQRKINKKANNLARLCDLDVKPDPNNNDFDFNKAQYYVPVPRARLSSYPNARALLASALNENPNAGSIYPSSYKGTPPGVVWVPYWLLINMPVAVYKILRHVWYIESKRQFLWQTYSGFYTRVKTFAYPGDFFSPTRNRSVWDVISCASADEIEAMRKRAAIPRDRSAILRRDPRGAELLEAMLAGGRIPRKKTDDSEAERPARPSSFAMTEEWMSTDESIKPLHFAIPAAPPLRRNSTFTRPNQTLTTPPAVAPPPAVNEDVAFGDDSVVVVSADDDADDDGIYVDVSDSSDMSTSSNSTRVANVGSEEEDDGTYSDDGTASEAEGSRDFRKAPHVDAYDTDVIDVNAF